MIFRAPNLEEGYRSAGFLVSWNDEATSTRYFGPEAARGLFSEARCGLWTAAVYGRLLYQDDLKNYLKGSTRYKGNSAALVLDAYRLQPSRWLELIEGEFACVITDAKSGTISVYRDPSCGPSVFWSGDGYSGCLATGLAPLLASGIDQELDYKYLAEFLALSWTENEQQRRSPYRKIRRIAPGHCLTIDRGKGRISEKCIFDWNETLSRLDDNPTKPDPNELRSTLKVAVKERSHGTVAAHLSGGMDSTAICLLTDVSSQSGEHVHSLSVLYRKLRSLSGETSFIDLVNLPNHIIRHELDGEALLDFDRLGRFPCLEEPYTGFFRLPFLAALIERADRLGASTILTGFGGDEALCDIPIDIAEDIQRGRSLTAWRNAAGWTPVLGRGQLGTLYEYGIAPQFRVFGELFLGGLNYGAKGDIGTSFLESSHLKGVLFAAASARRVSRARSAISVRRWIAHAMTETAGDAIGAAAAASSGIWISHPWRDPRVVRTFARARKVYRPLPSRQKLALATALKCELPDQLSRRPTKSAFDEVYFRGLSANHDDIVQLVDRTSGELGSLFDTDSVKKALAHASLGTVPAIQLQPLNNVLSILHWVDGRLRCG